LGKLLRYYSEEPRRGRPRGHRPYSVISVLSSIAHIAAKYNLDPMLLFDAFIEAQVHEESQCEMLKIKCRKVDKDVATFLITHEDKVIWQFPIKMEILRESEFRSLVPIIPTPAKICREDSSQYKDICELRAKMKGVAVKARIVEVQPRKLVNTMYGFGAYVSNILLADKTGTIWLSLWNSQIDDVAVGDTVNIEKASVTTFFGKLQLRLGRNGRMSIDTSTRELTTA